MSNKLRVVVTGANGMVGSHVVAELLLSGYQHIVAVVRSEKGKDKLFDSLKYLSVDGSCVKVLYGELQDYQFCLNLAQNCDIIVHAAAKVSFSSKDKSSIVSDNLTITKNIVAAAETFNISKFIHISSIATLSEVAYPELTLEKNFFSNSTIKSPYSISKFYCENEVIRAINNSLCGVVLLPAVILTKRRGVCGSASILPSLQKVAPFYAEGITGYVMVEDVARAVRLTLQSDKGDGERFILCSENLSFNHLQSRIHTTIGGEKPRYKIPNWVLLLLKYFVLKVEKCGFSPKISSLLISSLVAKRGYDGGKFATTFDFNYTKILDTV